MLRIFKIKKKLIRAWLPVILVTVLILGVGTYFWQKPVALGGTANLMGRVETCLSLEMNLQLSCVNEAIEKISKERGVRVALDVIEPFSQEHTYLLNWSHEFSHTIGSSAVVNHSKDLEKQIGLALVECDGYGAFGCYHGVIEAGLSMLPVEQRASVIRGACLENPLIQEKQYYVNQCLHWFGHGVAIFSNLTLEKALSMCEGLNSSFNSDEVQLCLSGLFHSGAVPGDSDDTLLHNVQNVWKKGDPYFPCQDIAERFRGHCYSHSPGRSQSSIPQVILSVCDNIPEKDLSKKRDYVSRCYETSANIILPQALGNNGLTDDQKAQQVVSQCRKFSRPEYRQFCYAGAARYWVLRDPLLTNLNPFKICKSAEDGSKPMCYANIGFGNNENYYSPEKLAEYCNNSEPKYIKDCLSRNPHQHIN
ncbi:MAG: hypothetical protein AAB638_01545 [Patescibacteria group bacterium]